MKKLVTFLGSGILIAGAMIACEDVTPADPVDEAILPGLFPAMDRIAHDADLVVVARKGRMSALRGGPTFSLGSGYVGEVHSPDFVEAWGIVAADGDDPDPDCEGSGIGFARCVKKHLDAGEECTLHSEGDTYHAHCEAPENPVG